MLRRPGIEPGSQEWESCMIPLHQRRSLKNGPTSFHYTRIDRNSKEFFQHKCIFQFIYLPPPLLFRICQVRRWTTVDVGPLQSALRQIKSGYFVFQKKLKTNAKET